MRFKLQYPSSALASVVLSIIMLTLTTFQNTLFDAFSLYAAKVSSGEYWRIFTASFVHFGWAHTLMNIAALVLATAALFSEVRPAKYLLLLSSSCIAVGLGIFCFNPEYQPYAGLSGAIHGLVVAGLLQTHAYPLWVRAGGIALVAGKLVQENLPGYEATDLQQLIPAAVAAESHVYGAIAGAAFALGDAFIQSLRRKH